MGREAFVPRLSGNRRKGRTYRTPKRGLEKYGGDKECLKRARKTGG